MVSLFLLLPLLLLPSQKASLPGCGLNIFAGRAGERLYYQVLQTSKSRTFSVKTDGTSPVNHWIKKGSVYGRPGPGTRTWSGRRTGSPPPYIIEISELTEVGPSREASTVRLPFNPSQFTWSEENSKVPWLFFQGNLNGRQNVFAFRQEGSQWIFQSSVQAELGIPRPDISTNRILMGRWWFAKGAAPVQWPRTLLPNVTRPGLLELYPRGRKTALAMTENGELFSTEDGGISWNQLPAPWPDGTKPTLRRLDSDYVDPVLSWLDDEETVRVARWRARWQTLVEVDRSEVEAWGPLVVVGDRAIVLSMCYTYSAAETVEHASLKGSKVKKATVTIPRTVMP